MVVKYGGLIPNNKKNSMNVQSKITFSNYVMSLLLKKKIHLKVCKNFFGHKLGLLYKLRLPGVNDRFYQVIKSMYSQTRLCVRCNHNLTPFSHQT